MKKILLTISLIISIAISLTSCQKTNLLPDSKAGAPSSASSDRLANNHWFRYDELRCCNPWEFNWLVKPTNEQLAGAVKSYLIGLGINVVDMRIGNNEKIAATCEDISCPDGISYFARVTSSNDMKKLLDLKFYEVDPKDIPEPLVSANIK